ncbi:hypothetical protein POF50_008065 [Streptomyces sp. SL13]|uniref:Uncharacterized protein n=1 Tax=Streptantibioticus silvisoli TaxID=2705255 RepID=A0AA90KFI3_9ACTN|nr:hypothetical protein [Streptantibioticus silvisoli]MDI5969300.1 hypothetical protein [Streptantibioticus silvisoli]
MHSQTAREFSEHTVPISAGREYERVPRRGYDAYPTGTLVLVLVLILVREPRARTVPGGPGGHRTTTGGEVNQPSGLHRRSYRTYVAASRAVPRGGEAV